MKKYLLFIAFTLVVFFNKAICQAWPIDIQSQQHSVVGTIGEDRSNRTRYHKGVDVPVVWTPIIRTKLQKVIKVVKMRRIFAMRQNDRR